MTDDLDRAEQAFRTALTTRADSLAPAVIGVPTTHRSRRRPLLLAAVATVVLVVGLFAVVLGHRQEAIPSKDLPAGWRWESHRNVMVGVPDTWGYAAAPDDQWCTRWNQDGSPAEGEGPSRPFPGQGYVNTSLPGDGSTDVKCLSDVAPVPLFVVHLSFLDRTRPAPVPDDWTNLSAVVDGQRLTVVTDQAHEALARRILATAHPVTTDQNGCDTTSPIQERKRVRPPAFDATSLDDVDTIAVCQYDLLGTGQPGLSASRRLTGQRARDEVAALRAAPIGGGPDRPGSCLHAMWDDAGVVLRLTTTDGSTHDMYAYYDGCFDNGIDDGTHVRELTTDNCRPLWGERVRDMGGIPTAFNRCVAPRR